LKALNGALDQPFQSGPGLSNETAAWLGIGNDARWWPRMPGSSTSSCGLLHHACRLLCRTFPTAKGASGAFSPWIQGDWLLTGVVRMLAWQRCRGDAANGGCRASNLSRRMADMGVRRAKAALSSGCETHPANAPAGSSRSGHGGNEVAEAFDVTDHVRWSSECAGRNVSER
jgi:hypothetical protein